MLVVMILLATQLDHSQLWGESGEMWTSSSRLPDFSHAGYARGEEQPPMFDVVCNVKSFGAVGDGVHDDSDAFIKAIAATKYGAIEIPQGRYLLRKIIEINKSNVVLRGDGQEKSVLVFDKPLNDIKPNWGATTSGRRTSNYSWSGGLLQIKGKHLSEQLAQINAPAMRGDKSIGASDTSRFKEGQQVEIYMTDDDDKSLTVHLYSNQPGNYSKHKKGAVASQVVVITEVGDGQITFDRPLRFDVKREWNPRIRSFESTVTNSGIESLGFEFPDNAYRGHFTELGFNAIALSNVVNCWVQDVKIVYADSGIFVNANFCTLSGLDFSAARKPKNEIVGHHGIILGGRDNLCTDFRFGVKFIHDLGVSANHAGNVFENGSGVDLNFDHHKRAPYENLYTNLDVGAGTRLWSSGGGSNLGKNCAARGTFWNIRAAQGLHYPFMGFGPDSMNLVAVQTTDKEIVEAEGKWFEVIDNDKLHPQNLYRAQLEKRMSEKWLTYAGDTNVAPGNGRRIVFVAGDEEYRSEESLPLLARSMNALGFECIVLFSQNRQSGEIDPDEPTYIPGLEKIEDADLLVLQLRFRELVDADMKYVADYVEAGKPLMGIRTSTHAFNYKNNLKSKYAHYTWTSKEWPGGFGKQVLGETWVAHHGHHGKEATRGLVASKHAVTNGVGVCFGTTDVYAINGLPDDAVVILNGEVVAGMKEEHPKLDSAKNNPMHPVAWLRERVIDEDTTQRIFATTMGAAADWADADLRKLFINSVMWCLNQESNIPVDGFSAPLIGNYQPTKFGFGDARLGYKPADYRYGSPWQPIEIDFTNPSSVQQFDYSVPSEFSHSSDEGGMLCFTSKSTYQPKFRSPFTYAILKDSDCDSFTLEFELKQTGENYGHRDLCLIFAYKNASDFCYAHLAPKPDEYAHNIFRVDNAPRTTLAAIQENGIEWTKDWHKVKVTRDAQSEVVQVFFDGAMVLEVKSGEIGEGRIGIGTFDDSGCVRKLRLTRGNTKN